MKPALQLGNAGITLVVTTFTDVQARVSKPLNLTWGQVTEKLTNVNQRDRKSDCPLLKLAAFGDEATEKGSLRHDANVLQVYGIEGDYDAGAIGVDEAAERLNTAGVEAFIYTTASHTPQKPRWRVLAPLSKPCEPSERRRFVAKLNTALYGILAAESFTTSQTYYYGRVAGAEYGTRRVVGDCIDTLSIDETYPHAAVPVARPPEAAAGTGALQPPATAEVLSDLRAALQYLDCKDYSEWIAVGQALKSLGDAGRKLWLEWSQTSSKFDDGNKEPGKTWSSFTADRTGYPAVFAKAQRAGWVNPRATTAETREDRTDAGNVAVLARISAGNLRYVPERNLWLWWAGIRWEADHHGNRANAMALQVAEHYRGLAGATRQQAVNPSLETTERKRFERNADALEKWAANCRSKRALDNLLGLAKRDARFTLLAEKLDCDPWLFGVQNGVVDLRKGTLRPDARDEFVTKRSPLAFDPNAPAPRYERFIREITGKPDGKRGYTPRPALAAYVQRALGYSMTGLTREHKMFLAIGNGANGKNILLDTVQRAMGDYCQTISPDTLMASRNAGDAERPSPALAMLAGARLAVSSESKEGAKLDVALVKRHTGGGAMTARHLHRNNFTFEVSHKLVLMTNHQPALDGMDDALRGRLHLIPFDVSWNRPGHPSPDPNRPDGDKGLMDTLMAEGLGILAWLVRGAVDYAAHGLEPPDEVAQTTVNYFKGQDPVSRWLETCGRCDAREGALASALYGKYREWCSIEGVQGGAASQTAFSLALKKLGVERKAVKAGIAYGIRVFDVEG